MEVKNITENGKELTFSKSRLFFYFFAIVILSFLITYYFYEIKGDIRLFVSVTPVWIVFAIIAQGGTYFFTAILYRKLLSVFNYNMVISVRELFEASIVSLFVNQTIPSGGISGNVFFFHFLRKKGISESHSLSVIFAELITVYTAMITSIVFLCAAVLFFWKVAKEVLLPILLSGIVIYGLMVFVIGSLGKGQRVVSVIQTLSRLSFLKKRLQKYDLVSLEKLTHPSRVFKEHAPVTAWAVFFYFCVLVCDSLTIFALFLGLNVPVSFMAVFTGLMLTRIISTLPISPGSLIVYEGSMAFFYATLGVPFAFAAVITLLYRALSFWLPMPIGFLLYRKLQYS